MQHLPQAFGEERSLDAVPHAPERHKPVGFMLRLAKALHTYGVPAYELETTLTACAGKLGFGLQCLSLPTSITMTLMRSQEPPQTFVIRVAPGDIHLDKLKRVSDVADKVMHGQLTTSDGADELKQINDAKSSYSWWMMVLSFALVSSAVARIFGGGWFEISAAFITGSVLGLLTLLSFRVSLLAHLLPAIAALCSTLVAYSLAKVMPATEVYISIVSGLVILLPGLTLTIAMAELATLNLMSGTSRLFGAGTVFILMAFGLVIGTQIAEVFGLTQMATAGPVQATLPAWTSWFAVALGSLSMVVLFQARLKDAGWVLMGGLVAFATVKYASIIFNNAMTAFIGAIVVGICANLVSRFAKIPGATLVIPGFIMLVPGSVGFKSLIALVEHDVVRGLDTAFNMIIVGISLVAGLLISSLVSLPKASAMQELETHL